MPTVTWSDNALDDLDDIYNFTLMQWDARQADNYTAGIITAVTHIRDFPEMGTLRRSTKGEVRRFRYESHYIVYRLQPADEVRILRVVHVRRDSLDEEAVDRA